MGVCVANFRSVAFFVWPAGVTQILEYYSMHKYINEYIKHVLVKIGISSTSCSPHVDFDNLMIPLLYTTFLSFSLNSLFTSIIVYKTLSEKL